MRGREGAVSISMSAAFCFFQWIPGLTAVWRYMFVQRKKGNDEWVCRETAGE